MSDTRTREYTERESEKHDEETVDDKEVSTTETRRRPETESEVESESETETHRCPECSGNLIQDEARGETVCSDCGLVVDENSIDRGPEWRAFDSAERDQKSRVGAPTTKLMHDKGLSTNIGWQDKDAYGNALSARQREQMQRLRTWNERFRTRDSKERNLKQALGEIDRMASALGLPESVRETASVIYRRALDEDLLPGRSIEGVATAALYAAARQAGTPRSLDEIERVSRVDRMELTRTYRYVVRELKLEIEPADPEQYVPRFASDLDLSDESERQARELLRNAKEEAIHSGKSPVGLAAAAVYAAALLTNEKVTQNEVSEVANVSEVTIRNRYKELLEADGAGVLA
ncbi:MAG: transcription initiation factor TFIIIB, Brf1 subunit/Transcription initiation factor TFIIB [Haloquadratum walsbyi J07HQW1]|jgi:Transcription initiation factor IIB (TFIIB)|uniref:Transcription initiation factor IIB n=1 Tax=Haloquadratum walsbyi J07HQW1 TaxID=1238424 RepID=U1MQW6_9EURY|nr:MAG: transcription initiation factor TFIIIB, Brf1 subunit/Transcription initiation factor TFIIB [Haloquadratum walsbyi J07HQW1]